MVVRSGPVGGPVGGPVCHSKQKLWTRPLVLGGIRTGPYLSVAQQVDAAVVWTEHHVPQDGLALRHRHRLIQQGILGRRRHAVHSDLKHRTRTVRPTRQHV